MQQLLPCHHHSVSEATRFLVEHEAVIDRARYNAPQLLPAAAVPRRKAAATTRHTVLLTGSRITDDSVLRIRPGARTGAAVWSATTTSAAAQAAAGSSRLVGYDLNTAWVELLIHSEQQRAAAAAARWSVGRTAAHCVQVLLL